jgi:hypothetical protein
MQAKTLSQRQLGQEENKNILTCSAQRNQWLNSNDKKLFSLCTMKHFQAPGPGGQKKNRKYSAIRIIHKPTNLSVTSTETRSQSDNRHIALRKLRIKLAIEIRGPSIFLDRLKISMSSPLYPSWIALLFDKLWEFEFSISRTAKSLNISTSKLVKLIARDSNIWQIINYNRENFGLSKLKW